MHRSPHKALAVLAVSLVLFAGCSKEGGTKTTSSDKTTTTAASTDRTTTTEDSTTTTEEPATTTTEPDDGGDAPTTAELEGLLPPASKLGDGWTGPEQSDDPDPALQAAVDDQCPAVNTFGGASDDNEVDQTYTNESGATLSISFDRTITIPTDDQFAEVLASINKCAPIEFVNDAGTSYRVAIRGQATDELGDQAARLAITIEGTPPGKSAVQFTIYNWVIRRGPVGLDIQGAPAISRSGEVTDFDTDLLDSVATTIDGLLDDAVG